MMMVRTSFHKSVHPLLTRQYLNFSLTRLVRICTFIQYVYSQQDAFSTVFARVMDAQQKREARLSRRRERERRNRASQSAEQRQARLARRRVMDRELGALRSLLLSAKQLCNREGSVSLRLAPLMHCIYPSLLIKKDVLCHSCKFTYSFGWR